jgi:tripeptide aminopeptidase
MLPCRMSRRHASGLHRFRSATALDGAIAHLTLSNARTLAWQCAVTRIAAPTGHEDARGAWLASEFASIGWTHVTIDSVGNVLARRPVHDQAHGLAATEVWCCAHLDTVFSYPAPIVTQDGARLLGPGIGDNGRGLAALLAIGHAMQAAGMYPPHDVVLIGTVGEEGLGDLRGMKHLLRDGVQLPHAVIAIDGAGDDRIVHAALGSSRYRVTYTGAGGHSWADFGVANPVHAVSALASALQAVSLPREPRTTLTVARIGGGESINSVPREGWLEVDMRSQSATVLTSLERTLHETAGRIERVENSRRTPGSVPLTVEVTLLGQRPCGALQSDAPLVRIAERATRDVGGRPQLAMGSTDASVPIARGIPAIAIGAGGRGGNTHTPDEWYDDTHGTRGLERALRIIAEAAGWR